MWVYGTSIKGRGYLQDWLGAWLMFFGKDLLLGSFVLMAHSCEMIWRRVKVENAYLPPRFEVKVKEDRHVMCCPKFPDRLSTRGKATRSASAGPEQAKLVDESDGVGLEERPEYSKKDSKAESQDDILAPVELKQILKEMRIKTLTTITEKKIDLGTVKYAESSEGTKNTENPEGKTEAKSRANQVKDLNDCLARSNRMFFGDKVFELAQLVRGFLTLVEEAKPGLYIRQSFFMIEFSNFITNLEKEETSLAISKDRVPTIGEKQTEITKRLKAQGVFGKDVETEEVRDVISVNPTMITLSLTLNKQCAKGINFNSALLQRGKECNFNPKTLTEWTSKLISALASFKAQENREIHQSIFGIENEKDKELSLELMEWAGQTIEESSSKKDIFLKTVVQDEDYEASREGLVPEVSELRFSSGRKTPSSIDPGEGKKRKPGALQAKEILQVQGKSVQVINSSQLIEEIGKEKLDNNMGIGHLATISNLRALIKNNKPYYVFLMETKSDHERAENLYRIISPYQGAFLSRRWIAENSIIAHELSLNYGKLQGVKISRGARLVTHLLLADASTNFVYGWDNSWKKLCMLKDAGGLGFRTYWDYNTALISKLGWTLASGDEGLQMNPRRWNEELLRELFDSHSAQEIMKLE
ncbi:hypothetical protein FNV43_RR21837 [Rhamnella rubrinervis]|uniref:Uncharacterized protein n=1 Tax=Rhamnella rubrinervis TaxID=2594499 RepID=A0A8K0E0S5_9ROSA|nr:hypothetical protein FNV43_RR21837 [Rhamnella rubrinervis]